MNILKCRDSIRNPQPHTETNSHGSSPCEKERVLPHYAETRRCWPKHSKSKDIGGIVVVIQNINWLNDVYYDYMVLNFKEWNLIIPITYKESEEQFFRYWFQFIKDNMGKSWNGYVLLTIQI